MSIQVCTPTTISSSLQGSIPHSQQYHKGESYLLVFIAINFSFAHVFIYFMLGSELLKFTAFIFEGFLKMDKFPSQPFGLSFFEIQLVFTIAHYLPAFFPENT